jgi:hypothetical protein
VEFFDVISRLCGYRVLRSAVWVPEKRANLLSVNPADLTAAITSLSLISMRPWDIPPRPLRSLRECGCGSEHLQCLSRYPRRRATDPTALSRRQTKCWKSARKDRLEIRHHSLPLQQHGALPSCRAYSAASDANSHALGHAQVFSRFCRMVNSPAGHPRRISSPGLSNNHQLSSYIPSHIALRNEKWDCEPCPFHGCERWRRHQLVESPTPRFR